MTKQKAVLTPTTTVPATAPVITLIPKRKGKKPGRKPKTKAVRIRELSRAGFTPKMIAAKVGAPLGYVYTVRSQMNGEMPVPPVAAPTPAPAPAPEPQRLIELPVVTPRPSVWDRIKAVFVG